MNTKNCSSRLLLTLVRMRNWRIVAASFGIFGLPTASIAAPCDAHYTFDDTLADSSGNGYIGQMIGADGARVPPSFTEGRNGSALRLDGTSAMRAFVDLNFEICPQVTIAAWIQMSPDGANHWLVSSGNGQGPGIRVSDTALVAEGTTNGISEIGVVRDAAGFFFVASVWDYSSGAHTLYWRSRNASESIYLYE